ncbi:hypothetical protein J6590_003296 [Homalodisca vitripennis]|nr:hypothetical protein J6590_003296 [Homalodisca vitripennis]
MGDMQQHAVAVCTVRLQRTHPGTNTHDRGPRKCCHNYLHITAGNRIKEEQYKMRNTTDMQIYVNPSLTPSRQVLLAKAQQSVFTNKKRVSSAETRSGEDEDRN